MFRTLAKMKTTTIYLHIKNQHGAGNISPPSSLYIKARSKNYFIIKTICFMRKKNLLLLSCLCLSLIGKTQQISNSVISSAGNADKINNLSLEWTLGEPAIETISSNNQLYTQGFHQPMQTAKILHTKIAVTQERYHITIAPNPVRTIFTAVIERETASKVFLKLSDLNGRPLISKTSDAKLQSIDFNLAPFSSGIYTLVISNASGSLFKIFKIIKAQ